MISNEKTLLSKDELIKWSNKINDYKTKNTILNKEINEIKQKDNNKILSLKEENENLIKKLDEINSQKDKFIRLLTEIEYIKNDLENDLLLKNEEIEAIKDINDMDLIHTIDILNNEIFNLKNSNQENKEIELLNKNELLTNEIDILKKNNNSLKNNNQLLEDNINIINDDISKYKLKLFNNNKENEKLLFQIQTLKKEIIEIKSKNDNFFIIQKEIQSKYNILYKKYHSEFDFIKNELTKNIKNNNLLIEENDTLNKEVELLRINLLSKPQISNTNKSQDLSIKNKMVVESMSLKINEQKSLVKELERKLTNYELKTQIFENKINEKDNIIIKLNDLIPYNNKIEIKKLNNEDKNRINNAKYNKSIEEMRDYLERIILENIYLKEKIN